jgi:Ni/Co efflux regulator RcnB
VGDTIEKLLKALTLASALLYTFLVAYRNFSPHLRNFADNQIDCGIADLQNLTSVTLRSLRPVSLQYFLVPFLQLRIVFKNQPKIFLEASVKKIALNSQRSSNSTIVPWDTNRDRDRDTDRDSDRDGDKEGIGTDMDRNRDMNGDGERDEDRDTDVDGDTERDRDISMGHQTPGNNFRIQTSQRF